MLDLSNFVQHFLAIRLSLNMLHNKFPLFMYLFAYLSGGFIVAFLVESVLLVFMYSSCEVNQELIDMLEDKLLGNKRVA